MYNVYIIFFKGTYVLETRRQPRVSTQKHPPPPLRQDLINLELTK